MPNPIRHIGLAAAALALAGAAAAGAPGTAAAEAASALRLSAVPAEGGPAQTATLRCRPDGGGHPDPRAACRTLARAGGDLDRIRPEPGPCTMELRPVVLKAEGRWRGERVDWSAEFTNRCTGNRTTAGVFAFGG